MQPEPDITDRRSRRDDAEDAREAEAPGTQDLPACIVNAAIAIGEERGRWSAVRLHDVAGKKGRTKAEVDEVICWLTGHSQETLDDQLAKKTNFEDFFAHAPQMNPSRSLITGVICGVRVEDIQEPTMREIRYLDKLIDELSKGRAMEKVLRK